MRAAPPLTLTAAELAAVVRALGRGRSLADCLRRIAQQRAARLQIPLTLDRPYTLTPTTRNR
jgi:hypothetical protein